MRCESVVDDEEEEEDINRKECKLKACGIYKHDRHRSEHRTLQRG